jgi:hypothetical protein
MPQPVSDTSMCSARLSGTQRAKTEISPFSELRGVADKVD